MQRVANKCLKSWCVRCKNGASGGTRTPNHLIRSQKLYPIELPTRLDLKSNFLRPEASVEHRSLNQCFLLIDPVDSISDWFPEKHKRILVNPLARRIWFGQIRASAQ